MMLYDKHGPLDLILYSDNREERRKWARNRIREMKIGDASARLLRWEPEIRQPEARHILSVRQLYYQGQSLLAIASAARTNGLSEVRQSDTEMMTREDAFLSIHQLVQDLMDATKRCYSIQNFLSTSLFLFWCTDELLAVLKINSSRLYVIGGKLIRHYIATAVLAHEYSLR